MDDFEQVSKALETNSDGCSQRTLDGKKYCVEFYDERFNENETDSIVEIWVPIKKRGAPR